MGTIFIKFRPHFSIDLTDIVIMQTGGCQLPMHRSRSVPVLNKEGSIKQMDSLGSVYRVVPTTPRITEQTSAASPPVGTIGAGTYIIMSND